MGLAMRASPLSHLLVLLALVAVSNVTALEIDQHDQGALVAPLEAVQLGEMQDPYETESEGDEQVAGKDAIDDLRRDVDSATTEDQVKSSMTRTIQKAMAEKKADLLTKASR